MPSDALADRLVDAYFQGPHFFCFYAFIHPKTFKRLHQQRLIPQALLLAVLATSLRYMDPQDPAADRWAEKSRTLVMADALMRFSALNLQTILLLARYEWHRGAHSSFSMLSAIASRMAYSLQLQKELHASELPELVLETRRRLMWSTFILETMPDPGGHSLNNLLIDPSTIATRYPSNDEAFSAAKGGASSPGAASWVCDISTYTTSLLVLRRHILGYSIAYHPRNDTNPNDLESPWLEGSRFASLERSLRAWGDNLPQGLAFSKDRVLGCAERGRLSSFLTLHFTFYGVHTDLYGIGYFIRRRLLASQWSKSPSPSSHEYQSMSDFLIRCSVERYKSALRALEVLTEAWPLLKERDEQTDPAVSIAAAMAFRIMRLEHLDDAFSDMETKRPVLPHRYVEVAMDCLQKTARWSLPTRRLLQALVQFSAKKGIYIALGELPKMTGDVMGTSNSSSVPASPTIRNLASDAALRHSLKASDRELISLENTDSDEIPAIGKPPPDTQGALASTTGQPSPMPLQQPIMQESFTDSQETLSSGEGCGPANLDMLDNYYFCSPDATSWLDQELAGPLDLDSWIFSAPSTSL
ncbi:fungal specific transcription factor domain-containing protein [Sarocladium implicatum]|nr:fungal specific transcription factor domain-containing protein [Sarocladium implicatum]